VTGALISRDDAVAVTPQAAAALADLRVRGVAHRYVRHVRSSQAFALNLFAPLDELGRKTVLGLLGLTVERADPVVFEFEDQQDRLAEASHRSPHRTQVDVLLTGTTSDGARVGALIEVKLGELDFGHCSGFTSPNNPATDVCLTAGLFGGDRDRCFQLNNHGYGRRRYAEYLPTEGVLAPEGPEDDGGCWLRRGRSQPMRNLALAHVLVEERELERAVYALCAPERHHTIWRRFREFTAVFPGAPTVSCAPLMADAVAYQQPDHGRDFFNWYAAAVPPRALVHLGPRGDELVGVWILAPDGPACHYAPGRQDEAAYAETLIAGQSWAWILERLPQTSPYMAWWEVVDHDPRHSAREVFEAEHARWR
jgi:hypothetical protein